ncbi:MAG: hypothetical protein RBT86_01740 [Azospira sp.]|nr:hypothetical protein [Azospira sp.]
MNNDLKNIRDEFLAMACRYLFGTTNASNVFQGFGLPALQPIPVPATLRDRDGRQR